MCYYCIQGLLFFCIVYTLLSQWEFLAWEIRVAFPKESQLQQSRAIQPILIIKALSCFHNSPNSDMDCRILCVRRHFFLVLVTQTGFEPRVFGSRYVGYAVEKIYLDKIVETDANIRRIVTKSHDRQGSSKLHQTHKMHVRDWASLSSLVIKWWL